MVSLHHALETWKNAAGIAGNIFAFGLFVSPIPTFQRIIRNRTTEQFSGSPYIYALLNCLICAWYGSPLVSVDNLLVTSVNSVGAVFQMAYIIIFIMYAERGKKLKMIGLVIGVISLFSVIMLGSLLIVDFEVRRSSIGSLSCVTLISMFASPLLVIKLVVRTRSVEFMPFFLSLSTFLMSTAFCLYGVLNSDPFVYAPNGMGAILGIIQLVLYSYYKSTSRQDSQGPLIESYDHERRY